MANSAPAGLNVYSRVAAQLSQVYTEEEILFQEALLIVSNRRNANGPLPKVFGLLNQAKTLADLSPVIARERNTNAVWKETKGKTWLKVISDFASKLLQCKDAVGLIVTASPTIGNPVWGAIAFLLAVVKDIPETSSAIEDLQERLRNTLLRFSEYHGSSLPMTGSLKAALLSFYIKVIDFVVDLLDELAKGRMVTIASTVVRSLKVRLDSFLRELSLTTNDVDQGANSRFQRKVLEELRNLSRFPPSSSTTANIVNGSSSLKTFGIPSLRNLNFTGRQELLRQMYVSLHRDPSLQRRMAIYGMGGIGKTQVLLKYVVDHLPSPNSVDNTRAYDYIFYFNASSRSLLSQSVAALLDALHIKWSTPSSNSSENAMALSNWLSSHNNWLLVFDDVRDLQDVRWCLPSCEKGHILFSTRYWALAQMLDSEHTGIEVHPMDISSATTLVSAMVQDSSFAEDRTDDIAAQVARFSKGLPLLMEQLTRNAFFSARPLKQVLTDVQNTKTLLQQKNRSSLHERNLSIGELIFETREKLRTESPQAEAILYILAYLEPSSICVGLIKAGAKDLQAYVGRLDTFDGDQAGTTGALSAEAMAQKSKLPPTSLLGHDSVSLASMKVYWRSSRLGKSFGQLRLPREESSLEKRLRSRVSQHSVLDQLLSQSENIEDAVLKLRSTAILRADLHESLWMHDVVAELVRALVEIEGQESAQTTALLAAMMVYCAFPPPHLHVSTRMKEKVRLYFPHLLKTHAHLVELQILNETSIGPELSHLIASTYSKIPLDALTIRGSFSSAAANDERQMRILVYYQDAFAGYRAAWKRLSAMHGVKEENIVTSTRDDYQRVCSMLADSYDVCAVVVDASLYGRSAPWRALLTGLKIASLHEKSRQGLAEAVKMYQFLVPMSERLFGPADQHTKYIHSQLRKCLVRVQAVR